MGKRGQSSDARDARADASIQRARPRQAYPIPRVATRVRRVVARTRTPVAEARRGHRERGCPRGRQANRPLREVIPGLAPNRVSRRPCVPGRGIPHAHAQRPVRTTRAPSIPSHALQALA